ncbi:hypothetical protein LHU53_15535 [Rhodoferax sp. U2-2l]|uniref:hypothetical protein n=1 Tax=Rhodoferax sp. U2-2l TaxID=2884000 RepID=UPI001D09A6E3|nr:hypothetical protein [Rhodoferax sp. U2-2l]MCB8748312.1 hypothetical protein [Rhodoferax sp. U2-2l]
MIDLDIIGTLYTPGTDDEQGNALSAPVPLPGYHVNASAVVAGWESFKVTPTTPRRVFGGHPTHFYTFASQAEFEAALATADLDPPVVVVPQSVTMRQGCRALEAAGLLADVEAAIAAAPRYVQIDWERATSIDRAWPTLAVLKDALGLTDAQIDALFIEADTL